MSWLQDFAGGMATTGAGIIGQQREAESKTEQAKIMADYNSELEIKRQRVMEALKEEFKINSEKAAKATAAKEGQEIDTEAKQLRLGRIASVINQKEGSSMTPEDAQSIAENPEAMKAYGIIDRTRAQEYDDKASIAEKKGLINQAKEFRGQQGLELQRDSELRREAKSDQQFEISNKRMDNLDKHQTEVLAETIRHNKALESAAFAKTGAEKLSPAAKAQLELSSARLGAAQNEQSLASKALAAALKSNEMDPAKRDADIKTAREDVKAAEARVAMAISAYDDIGAKHFGDDWKPSEIPEAKAETAPPDPFPKGTVKNGFVYQGGGANNRDNWTPVEAAPKKAAVKAEEPKEGDTRTVNLGRGRANVVQIYQRSAPNGRGVSTLAWTNQ